MAEVECPEVRVQAIIVAYNSPEAIARCLRSLDAQTRVVDAVLIVDNSDREQVDLSDLELDVVERTTVLPAGDNLGPAGGFALGLAAFQEDGGFTHAWLMDDDCYPDPTSLDLLVSEAVRTRPGIVCFPSAVYEATGVAMNYPGWSGVLIDRLAVRLGGLPRAELFWWVEDTEYLQFRLPRKGVQVVRVPEARVLYDLIRRTGGRPAWKYYYEVRNMIWYRLSVERGAKAWTLARTLIRLLGSAVLSNEGRGEKIKLFAKGVVDGFSGRLGAEVRPSRPRSRGDVTGVGDG